MQRVFDLKGKLTLDARNKDTVKIIKPEILLLAYKSGYFPMADSADGDIYWHFPDPRAIFPINEIKMPRSLRKSIEKNNFTFTVDKAFYYVIDKCSKRYDTWISKTIIDSYSVLFNLGHAHSVETWKEGKIVGGLYGVSIGGAFFGESMFNDIPETSKAAFYHLIEILKKQGYILLDSQYINAHTKILGAIEIPSLEYMDLLAEALKRKCIFE